MLETYSYGYSRQRVAGKGSRNKFDYFNELLGLALMSYLKNSGIKRTGEFKICLKGNWFINFTKNLRGPNAAVILECVSQLQNDSSVYVFVFKSGIYISHVYNKTWLTI